MISRIYAAGAFLSAAGLGASVVYKPLVVLTPALSFASVACLGAATKCREGEREAFRTHVKQLLLRNAEDVITARLDQKPAGSLTEREIAKLAMLPEKQIVELDPAVQAEVLKAQILMHMLRAAKKGASVQATPLFAHMDAARQRSAEGLALLREERDNLGKAAAPKSEAEQKKEGVGGVISAAGSGTLESVAKKVTKNPIVPKLFAVGSAAQVVWSSGQILFSSSLPRYETVDDLVDDQLRNIREARQKFGQNVVPLLPHFKTEIT